MGWGLSSSDAVAGGECTRAALRPGGLTRPCSPPAPATMPRKGTQPSTARRGREEPPQSPDGPSSDAEPEPPPGRAGSPAPASTGKYLAAPPLENARGGQRGSAPKPGLAGVWGRGAEGLRSWRL